MGKLYSITGLFAEDFPGISPWGGHFIKQDGEGKKNQISGQLIDLHGQSRLNGFLEKKTLKFRKNYERCNHEQIFDYEFSLEDGIWQGRYSSPKGNYSGISICKVNLCLDDVGFRDKNFRTQRGYVDEVIQAMMDAGVLEVVDDSEKSNQLEFDLEQE